MTDPIVCAICLTRDRPEMAARAVRCFRRQTYDPTRRWLLIFDTGDPSWYDGRSDAENEVHCKVDPIHANESIGKLRNRACEMAGISDVIVHWDSDDWSHPNRIAEQVALLQSGDYDAVGYREMLFWRHLNHKWTGRQMGGDPADAGSYEWVRFCDACGLEDTCEDSLPNCDDGEAYLYTHGHSDYIIGTSLMYYTRTWRQRPFGDRPRPGDVLGEDHVFQSGLRKRSVSAIHTERFIETSAFGTVKEKMAIIDREPRMVATIHGANTSMGNYTTALETGNCFKRVAHWDSAVRRIMEES